MSDVHESPNTEATTETANEIIDKAKYKKSLDEMHAAKSAAKELKAKLDALNAEREAQEMASLREQEKWKELFQKTENQLKTIQSERDSERSKFIDAHKKNAVVTELGGFKRPEYMKFINVSAIEVDENGEISAESIAAEVQRIKKEYPELVKVSAVGPLPSGTPKTVERNYSELNEKEKMQLKFELLNKNKTK